MGKEAKPYDNREIFKAWIRSGINSYGKIQEYIGIEPEEAYSLFDGKEVASSEIVARTLEITNEQYDTGASVYLDPWMRQLREQERREKIRSAKTGSFHTEETKKKISELKKGIPLSEETKAKMSAVRKGRPGKPLSPESIDKIRAKKIGVPSPKKGLPGKPHTPQSKRKLSEALKGRTFSQETRDKISKSRREGIARKHAAQLSD